MLRQYDGWTAEDIQRRHGCDALTALHVVQARAEFVEMHQRHAEEMRGMLGRIDRAGRIGFRVLIAERSGRKTVRIADLIEGA